MANVNEARQANMGSNNGGKTDWQKQLDMLSMAALAQGANPATMAGFALGKWLSGYLGRGQDNKDRKIKESLENGGSTAGGSTTGGSTTSNTGATKRIITTYRRFLPNLQPLFSTSSIMVFGFTSHPIKIQVAIATSGISRLLLI